MLKFELKVPPRLQKFFGGQVELVHEDALFASATELKANMISDSLKGVDKNGTPFKAYSENPIAMHTTKAGQPQAKKYTPAKPGGRSVDYASKYVRGRAAKIENQSPKTRRFDGGYREYKADTFGNDTVNMVNTGRTFENIHFRRKTKNAVEVFIRNKDDNDVAALNNEKRNWFGFSKNSTKQILEIFRRALHETLKRVT